MKFSKLLKVLCTFALAASLTACGSSGSDKTETATDLSGTIRLNGSTSMEKYVTALAEGFQEANSGVTVEPQFTGSTAGITALQNGSADIGDASRSLTDEEKESGLVENIVAIDGIGVIANKDVTVTDITTEDLAKVYSGEITNWKDLGGEDESIVVIGRESGSGTRDAFEELLDIKNACKYSQEIDSTGAVLSKVQNTAGSIGYVSLDVVDDSVVALKIGGVEASKDTILDGTYALQRPFVMATKGEISEQSELIQAFFEYVKGEEGQNIIESVGLFVPNE